MEMSIKFSNITEEKINAYIEENLRKQAKFKEKFFYEMVQITRYCGLFYILNNLWDEVASFLSYLYLEIQMNMFFIATFIYLIVMPVLYLGITRFCMENVLFPSIYEIKEKEDVIREIKCNYYLFHFQDLLKTKHIEKIKPDGKSRITVEYKEKNGCHFEKTYNVSDFYKKIITDECIDFSWFDDFVNDILKKNNYKEI